MASESHDEVRQRIENLYDRAENATGNYNATRAGSRGRGVPLRKRAGGDADLDNVSRQWFDVARAKLGPTVPAVLPSDRMPPRRPAGSPSAPGGEREPAGRPLPPELTAGATGRAVAELTGRPVAELPGRAVAELPGRPVAELTARPVAALPAVPEPRRELEAAAGALLPAPATAPRRPSPATSKERNRGKLTAARELLSRHAAQHGTPIAAIESRPAEESWFPAQQLGATGSFTTGTLTAQPGMPTAATSAPLGPSPFTDTGSFTPVGLTDTGSFVPASPAPQTGMPTGPADPYATGPYAAALGPSPFTDTGSFTPVGLTDTGSFVPASPAPQTGMPTGPADPYATGPYAAALGPSPFTDTGSFTPVGLTDTGSFVPASPAPQTGMPTGPADPYATGPYATGSFSADALMAQSGMSTAAATAPLGPSPLMDTGTFAAPVTAGGTSETAYAGKAMKALDFARAQIGRPCVWGAMGPDSYDCSSLTQAAWKAAGVALPRTAAEQADAGTPVALADIQVGDLIVFFDNAGHVGFCTGNGMMIHAPGPGAFIREESIYGAGESAIHRVIRPA